MRTVIHRDPKCSVPVRGLHLLMIFTAGLLLIMHLFQNRFFFLFVKIQSQQELKRELVAKNVKIQIIINAHWLKMIYSSSNVDINPTSV